MAEQDAGSSIEAICLKLQISPATLYNWKKDLAIDQDGDQRRLKESEADLTPDLRRCHADLILQHQILSEGYEMVEKYQAQDAKKK